MVTLKKSMLAIILVGFLLFYIGTQPQFLDFPFTSGEFFQDVDPDHVNERIEPGEQLTLRKPKSIIKDRFV